MSGVLWSTDSSVTLVTSPSEGVLIIDVVVAFIFTLYVDFGLLLKAAYSSYLVRIMYSVCMRSGS